MNTGEGINSRLGSILRKLKCRFKLLKVEGYAFPIALASISPISAGETTT